MPLGVPLATNLKKRVQERKYGQRNTCLREKRIKVTMLLKGPNDFGISQSWIMNNFKDDYTL
jgi:hypothetical protein